MTYMETFGTDDFDTEEGVTITDISHKARIPSLVARALAEHIEPRDVGTALHVFVARQIGLILLLESLFCHGFFRPDLADYHARLCRERDEALRDLKIENPFAPRSI